MIFFSPVNTRSIKKKKIYLHGKTCHVFLINREISNSNKKKMKFLNMPVKWNTERKGKRKHRVIFKSTKRILNPLNCEEDCAGQIKKKLIPFLHSSSIYVRESKNIVRNVASYFNEFLSIEFPKFKTCLAALDLSLLSYFI